MLSSGARIGMLAPAVGGLGTYGLLAAGVVPPLRVSPEAPVDWPVLIVLMTGHVLQALHDFPGLLAGVAGTRADDLSEQPQMLGRHQKPVRSFQHQADRRDARRLAGGQDAERPAPPDGAGSLEGDLRGRSEIALARLSPLVLNGEHAAIQAGALGQVRVENGKTYPPEHSGRLWLAADLYPLTGHGYQGMPFMTECPGCDCRRRGCSIRYPVTEMMLLCGPWKLSRLPSCVIRAMIRDTAKLSRRCQALESGCRWTGMRERDRPCRFVALPWREAVRAVA